MTHWTCLLTCLVVASRPGLSESRGKQTNPMPGEVFNLLAALKDEDAEAASAALKAGADINFISSPDGARQTGLMQSVLHGRPGMVEWCLDNGADATIAEKDGYTLMHGAAIKGNLDVAKVLHERGIGLRDLHEDGYEPMLRACTGSEEKHTATVAWFLDSGVPLDEVYDRCKLTANSGTIDLLQDRLMAD